MSVFTVVYFSHICYESHPSCYFDCAYIGVSEGDMRDDSIATIGSQFPIYIIILFIRFPDHLAFEKRTKQGYFAISTGFFLVS